MTWIVNFIKNITRSYQFVTGLFITLGSVFFYFVFRKNIENKVRSDINNKILKDNLDSVIIETNKAIKIQEKQNILANKPSPGRDDIHKWMRGNRKKS